MMRYFLTTIFFLLVTETFVLAQEHPGQTGGEEGQQPAPAVEIPAWISSLKPKLELRYRHEMIDEQDEEPRNRQRIRARIGTEAIVSEDVDLTFQLAGGSDDPVSNNQTLGEGFTSKGIQIDIASFNWHPGALDAFSLSGGKVKRPFLTVGKSELIWDDDLNPEGLYAAYEPTFGPVQVILRAYGFWVEERAQDDDANLLGGQVAVKVEPSENLYLLVGGSYYDYTNTAGYPTFWDPEDSFGNTVTEAGGPYDYDYNLAEAYAEIGGTILDLPVAVFGDYVINTDIEDGNNRGWLAGFYAGKCKKPMSFSVRYNYRQLESDAVVGVFTDSDFIGGGTDGSGHEINIGFQVTKHIKTDASYFINQQGLDDGRDFRRLQLDISFKF